MLCLAALGYNAKAANYYWDINGTAPGSGGVSPSGVWEDPNWATVTGGTAATGNWVDGNFPRFTAATDATGSYTITINSNHTFVGMLHSSFAATVTFTGPGVLTILPTGGAGPGGAQQGFFGGTGGTLLFQNKLSGTGGIQSSSGQITLEGTNDYSGGTTILAGLINFNNNSSFGTGLINVGVSGSALIPEGTAALNIPNNWTNSINNAGLNCVGNTAGITYSGNIALGANTLTLGCGGGTGALDIFSGTISGTGGIGRQSSASHGTIRFTGANTYTGKTLLQSSVTSVSSLNSVSSPAQQPSSNLGVPSSAANGTIGMGATTFTGTLLYTGAGETTDRVIDLAGTTGGGTIQNDGSGPLVFTSASTATGSGVKKLTLQGSNAGNNTFSGKIVNGASATAVVKAGNGLWRLSGTNTYTGGTTINAGTLVIGPTGSVAGNVTNVGGVLQLDSPTALSSAATLSLPSAPADNSINLNFTGSQVINALYIGTDLAASGTWGSPSSGAQNTSPAFTGTGLINVLGAPVILQQPQSITCYPGSQNRSFTVVVSGDPSFTYQWKLNGNSISGANDSTYNIPSVSASDAGTYICAIVNNFGSTNTASATLTVLATNSYVNAILADNPLAYWRLDETNGTLAQDGVGGNIGKYVNVTLNQPGYSQTEADGSIGLPAAAGRGFVQVTNYTPFAFAGASSIALEAWVNFTNVTGVQRIFSTFAGVSPAWGYAFGINGANGLRFTTSTVQDADQALSTALVPGLWYHLVLTSDQFNYHFYVNGHEVGPGVSILAANTGVNVPLQLGSNPATYPAAEQVNGRIDEAAIYTYLSADQVLAHYNARYGTLAPPVVSTPVATPATNYVSLSATIQAVAAGQALSYQWFHGATLLVDQTNDVLTLSPLQLSSSGTYKVQVSNPVGTNTSPDVTITVLSIPASAAALNLTNGLVVHLPFDGDYADISGHSNNGTNVGATTFVAPGAIGGNGLHYFTDTGSSSFNYVTLGVRPDLQFGTNVDFTVAFWVRQPAGSTFTNLPFFTDAVGSTSHGGFAFAPFNKTGGGGWMWTIGTVTSPNAATTFPDLNLINDGNWHHLVHSASRTANCTTYLDGVQVDSQSVDAAVTGNINTAFAATIGQDPSGAYPVTAEADLDDLAVWRRALTPLEVSGIYLAGATNNVSFAPVVSVAPVPVALHLDQVGGQWQISWTGAGGALQASGNVTGTYTNVPSATSPYIIPTLSGPQKFYRLKY